MSFLYFFTAPFLLVPCSFALWVQKGCVEGLCKKVVEGKVDQTIPREELWQIQTPQAFQISFIQEVHERARQEGFFGTDDASLVEHYGYAVEVTEGSYMNIKLTTPDDLVIGEAILKMKERGN